MSNNKQKKRIYFCLFGSVLEWYDFMVYASLSPILSEVFFPNLSKALGIILIFTIFSVSFITRPLGGIVFGYIADKIGRRKSFLYSISIISITSFFIAILPAYHFLGLYAPLFLGLFRLCQGIAIGGEYPVLIAYLYEVASVKNKGFITGLANVSTVFGLILATITVFLFTNFMSEEVLYSWGWRLPFLITTFFSLILLYGRMKMMESMWINYFEMHTQIFKNSIKEAVEENKKNLIQIFGIVICPAIAYYTYNFFSISYLKFYSNFDYLQILMISIISGIFLILSVPFFAFLSDIYNREKIITISAISYIVLTIPLFFLFQRHHLLLSLLSQFLFALMLGAYLGPLPAFMVEKSHRRWRCSSIGGSYNLCLSIFGGTTPTVNALLIKTFHSNLVPCVYLILGAIVSLISICFLNKTNRIMESPSYVNS